MTGIPISGALYVYGDNMWVIHNISKPESTLKKKCQAIAYHAAHESVAMRLSLTEHIRSEDNLADLLTEIVTRKKGKHLLLLMLYFIFYGYTL